MQPITLQPNEFIALYTMASIGVVAIAVTGGQYLTSWLQRHDYLKDQHASYPSSN